MDKTGREILFNDIFQKPVKFTSEIRKVKNGIRGNVRLSCGLYYTDAEKEEYINKSLETELP